MKITSANNGERNRYIQSMTMNNENYDKNFLTHETLLQGGTINFSMSDEPNKLRGIKAEDAPYSFTYELKSGNKK